ncbi:hypothetical protein COV94_01305 [Candidatus Woesearchaeota archaeon CG11_big_fil_rev_8_21_14_0_20_57_5]|nr:MAG: hypothetical protein COV94_01305 [Candidatus Woesearchaeota archaeon CG11_big_fil_rev_8_21_14_0_20_57_5]
MLCGHPEHMLLRAFHNAITRWNLHGHLDDVQPQERRVHPDAERVCDGNVPQQVTMIHAEQPLPARVLEIFCLTMPAIAGEELFGAKTCLH